MTFPGATPPPGADPLDPSVLDLLRGSALAPMLDQPVSDILQHMGLPQLPQLPPVLQLPELPPLPTLDLTALMRPLTDLASAFGTGQLGAPAPAPVAGAPSTAAAPAPSADPTQMLSTMTSVLQTVMSVGSSALQAVMSVWQGMAAMEAAQKASQAQQDGAELATQSTQEKAVLAHAAGSVFTGSAQMSAVVSKFSATLAMAPLYIATPPGQAFLVTSAVESMSEALAITIKTKGELAGHSATMAQAGEKVPITNAPKGVKSTEQLTQLTQLLSMVTPLISTATQAAQSLGQLATSTKSLSAVKPIADETHHDVAEAAETDEPGAGLGAGGGLGGGALGSVGSGPAQLNPWQGTRVASAPVGAVGGPTLGGSTSVASAPVSTAGGTGAGNGNGYMPMSGAGATGAGLARDGESSSEALRGQMVTGQHGDEVVGPIEGVTLPVVGAADLADEPPPDKELTL